MSADLTVMTCTIPAREDQLARNIESVRDQSVPVHAHLISSDDGALGPIVKYNSLARAVTTQWLAILDDDNYWFHDHIETILPHFDDADVIYTWDAGLTRPRYDLNNSSPADAALLFQACNVIDQSCAIRSEMFDRVGGFAREGTEGRPMDQDLWYRIAQAGGRFRCVPKETWFYTAR